MWGFAVGQEARSCLYQWCLKYGLEHEKETERQREKDREAKQVSAAIGFCLQNKDSRKAAYGFSCKHSSCIHVIRMLLEHLITSCVKNMGHPPNLPPHRPTGRCLSAASGLIRQLLELHGQVFEQGPKEVKRLSLSRWFVALCLGGGGDGGAIAKMYQALQAYFFAATFFFTRLSFFCHQFLL